jgi:predicted nucleotidyltransferase
VYLFGSCLNDIDSARDIDITVSGVRPEKFFELYGRILGAVDSEVDLLPLENTREYLANRIFREGKVLYERGA